MKGLRLISLALLLVLAYSIRKQTKYNYFNYGCSYLPRADKVAKGGDDANYESENLLAVADGVGGWELVGVDPSAYSRKLVSGASELFKQSPQRYVSSPRTLMQDAWSQDLEKGSSTFLLVTLDEKTPNLHVAQVGDSGFAVFRNENGQWKTVYPYQSYQLKFNMPYQLAANIVNGNDPSVAVERTLKVQNNDIIIMGTDGLFDNLFEGSMINILRDYAPNGILDNPQELAQVIANAAQRNSVDPTFDSPFAINARRAGLGDIGGGKPDDITVVVAQIKVFQ